MTHRDNLLDCVRALAVTLVVFTHYHAWMPGGSIGVSVFFCLSGFLITGILLRLPELSPNNIARFIFRRFMRVWPMMAFQLLLVLALMAVLAPGKLHSYTHSLFALITFTGGYDKWVGYSPAVLWTLRAEFWFYVLFPITLCAAGRDHAVKVIVAGIVIGWAAKFFLGHGFEGYFGPDLSRGARRIIFPVLHTFVYLDQLMYGALIGVFAQKKVRFVGSRLALWIPVAAICLLGTIPFYAYDLIWYAQTSVAALLTAVIIWHQVTNPVVARLEPFATIGKISYSIYLLHAVAIDFLPYPIWNAQLSSEIAFTLILAASMLTFRCIEAPCIAWARKQAPFLPSSPVVFLDNDKTTSTGSRSEAIRAGSPRTPARAD